MRTCTIERRNTGIHPLKSLVVLEPDEESPANIIRKLYIICFHSLDQLY